MASIRGALTGSFLDRYASLAIAVASSMLLARLLTPEEIGAYSIVASLLVVASTLRDLGAGQYLVRETELTNDRVRAVWTVQLGVGMLLALLVAAASHAVAAIYGEPAMRDMMLVLALTYALNPFGSITYAYLSRELRFSALASIRLAATVAGAVTSILLAWAGFGPMSLVLGSLVSTAASALAGLLFRPRDFPWLPGTRELAGVLRFGSSLTLVSMLRSIAAAMPELFLGRLQSIADAGFYSRANGLVDMFHRLVSEAVLAVALPWFSKAQRETDNVAEAFLKGTAYMTAIGWSFCAFVALMAQPMVRLLYGWQWDNAIDLARVLAACAALRIPATLCSSAMIAVGATGELVRATLWGTGTFMLCALLGAILGLHAMGWLLLVAAAIGLFVWMRASARVLGFAGSAMLRTSAASALVACMASIAPLLVLLYYGADSAERLAPLALALPGSAAGFAFAAIAFRHPLGTELRRFASLAAAWRGAATPRK